MDAPIATDSAGILDLVHDSVVVRDMDGRVLEWNAAAEAMYGWSRDEAVGRRLHELLDCRQPEDLPALETRLHADGCWEGELCRAIRGGDEVWVALRWSLRRDSAGRPACIVETGRDVTRRRAAEEAARMTEYRYRNLFQTMPVAFWEVDFTGVGALLLPLRDAGVELRGHLAAHPDLVREAMRRARVVDVNDKAVSLFGAASRDQVVGGSVEPYWPDASLPVFAEALVETFEKRPHMMTETRLRGLDGRDIDALFTVSWSPESRRRGILLIGIVDIGDRKRAFEALECSELRYRNLFNYMPIALWQLESHRMRDMFDELARHGVTDFRAWIRDHPEFLAEAAASMTVTEANEQTLKLFGAADRETLLARMPDLWIDPGDFADAALARLTGARYYSKESPLRTVDGRRVDVLFSVAFGDPDAPESLNLVGAVDISESKRATAALARSELKYRNLFQHMPISLWQIDTSELTPVLARLRAEGVADLDAYFESHPGFLDELMQLMRVEQVNERTVRLFGGRTREDFVGPVARYWQDSPGTLRRSLVARFAGAESYAEETRVRALDGRAVDVFYTSAFPAALSEMGIGLVGAIDIGDRLQAERLLRQVQADFAHAARVATLGELTASIAHEINQPLAAIVTNGEAGLRWLARDEPDIEEVRTLAARMVADARRAADIIAHIRAMASRASPVHARVDVNALVGESLAFLRHELAAHDVTVSLALAPDLPAVSADPTQIQQVVVNLAVNAMQAMAQASTPGPRLAVRTLALGDGRVRIEVEDSGPGIPPDDAARLFDSFFTTKPDGLGIGLSLSRSIVECHGGEIGFVDTGHGALFGVTLPAVPEAAPPVVGAPAHTNV